MAQRSESLESRVERRLGVLVPALYVAGFVLILAPAVEVVLTSFPPRPADATWRIGFAGLLSQSLLVPTLGLAAVILGAFLRWDARVLRLSAVSAAVIAGLLVLIGVLFSIDAMAFWRATPDESAGGIIPAVLNTLVSLGLVTLAIGAVARAAWMTSRTTQSETFQGLIVGDPDK